MIWRLGPHALKNQFSFVDDARGFGHQHDIRRLPNGHITIFDNGNYLTPVYSRAVEYELDEANKVATQAWEYRETPDVYGGFMGNVQRQTDGGTTIGWGGTFSNPKLTDLHADGSKALEVAFEDPERIVSYRAFRFPWRTNRFVTEVDSLEFGEVEIGNSVARQLTVRNATGSDLTLGCFVTTDSAYAVPGPVPITIAPDSSASVEVDFTPTYPGEHAANLYIRQVGDDELVAQVVALHGTVSGVVAVGGSRAPGFALEAGRPNPFNATTSIGFTLPRATRFSLEVLDVHGRKVETLLDEARSAGSYVVTWKAGARADGMYFCRLKAGNQVLTRKLVLTK
jgi:hypothetical protein